MRVSTDADVRALVMLAGTKAVLLFISRNVSPVAISAMYMPRCDSLTPLTPSGDAGPEALTDTAMAMANTITIDLRNVLYFIIR